MAKNRRQFIDGIKLAFNQLRNTATDRDFLPQVRLLLAMYDRPKAEPRRKAGETVRNLPGTVATGG